MPMTRSQTLQLTASNATVQTPTIKQVRAAAKRAKDSNKVRNEERHRNCFGARKSQAETLLVQILRKPTTTFADRWSYSVPIPLYSILEVLELIMPATMSALAVHNIQMMNDGAFANVRLPSYASFLDALMK